jgi:putative addiction module component (TIGR02574 family)
MAPDTLADLLRLPSGERADLAMALWASLDDDQRGAELALTRAQAAEFDRRLEEHRADPGSALPWEDVRRKLLKRP